MTEEKVLMSVISKGLLQTDTAFDLADPTNLYFLHLSLEIGAVEKGQVRF